MVSEAFGDVVVLGGVSVVGGVVGFGVVNFVVLIYIIGSVGVPRAWAAWVV